MALTNISRTGNGDVIGSFPGETPDTSYKCQVLSFSPTTAKEFLRMTTLCDEPYGASEEGESNAVVACVYKIMKGASALAPLVMANPPKVPITWVWDTGCELDGDWNITTSTNPRNAGVPVNVGSFVAASDGPYTITWAHS